MSKFFRFFLNLASTTKLYKKSSYDLFVCIGFTSKKLLKLIAKFGNRGCWHIDATYKIIKYCYPLIVIGFTDDEVVDNIEPQEVILALLLLMIL